MEYKGGLKYLFKTVPTNSGNVIKGRPTNMKRIPLIDMEPEGVELAKDLNPITVGILRLRGIQFLRLGRLTGDVEPLEAALSDFDMVLCYEDNEEIRSYFDKTVSLMEVIESGKYPPLYPSLVGVDVARDGKGEQTWKEDSG